ncbi:DUF1667 domain-containing protein [Aminithiophilus ramosus]|uniref:DUF1667 domain-containing protein n=2 Tax=Synergistales TaxID=649776 RepID=A0A9Q7ACV0_9BACT|nr:DUF1667 domain-containing protein [Aminithiophilus ramosus]QTX32069.1 DUF1667 domain-containing protein [Aminithiophilus ramosus]QVL35935.1 DUF1667 domain-containing protein [Synergistota bacterium]
MSLREFVCVVCPNGCLLSLEISAEKPAKLLSLSGQGCPRGEIWARQEIENPLRTIASSVLVADGDFPLVSVRTDAPIPLASVPAVMAEIRRLSVEAPVRIGDVLLAGPAGTACNVIATRSVRRI